MSAAGGGASRRAEGRRQGRWLVPLIAGLLALLGACGGAREAAEGRGDEASAGGERPAAPTEPCAWIPPESDLAVELDVAAWRRWPGREPLGRLIEALREALPDGGGGEDPLDRALGERFVEEVDRLAFVLWLPEACGGSMDRCAGTGQLRVATVLRGGEALLPEVQRGLQRWLGARVGEERRVAEALGMRAHALGAGLWAVSSRAFREEVRPRAGCRLREGEAAARFDGLGLSEPALRLALSELDLEEAGGRTRGLREGLLAVELRDDGGLRVGGLLRGEAQAVADAEAEARAVLDSGQLRMMLAMMGLSDLVGGLRLERRGEELRLELQLDGAQWRRALGALESFLRLSMADRVQGAVGGGAAAAPETTEGPAGGGASGP